MIQETSFQRYRRLVSGPTSLGRWILEEILWGPASLVPGLPGLGLRRFLAPFFLAEIGAGSAIDRAGTLRCPSQISLGRGIIIESQVHLLAGSSRRLSLILENGVYIRSFSVLDAGPPDGYIHLGRGSRVGHHCVLHGHGGIEIGRNVMLAAGCALVASMHIHQDLETPIKDQGFTASGITIEDGVWLGTGVKVLDGVTIGRGTIVGAGSVVTTDLPDYSVAAGVPAKVKKSRSQASVDCRPSISNGQSPQL